MGQLSLCATTTEPVLSSPRAATTEARALWAHVPQLLSPRAATTEARTLRAHALQQEKPPQWEACAPQRRVAPARRN